MHDLITIGWRERLSLPDLGLGLKAKIDTGARTSALHVSSLEEFDRDGRTWLRFGVDTTRGKVLLTGKADTQEAKDAAGKLATNTRGVSSVKNLLVVENAKPSLVKAEVNNMADGWITTKVKSTFAYSTNVDGSDIGVKTHEGVVTLSGKVDSGAERALAIELAKNVRGVKSVDSKELTM